MRNAIILTICLLTGCSTVPQPPKQVGDEIFNVNAHKICGLTVWRSYDKVVTDEAFEVELERESARADLDNEKQQKRWCNYVMLVALAAAGVFALIGWFTHQTVKFGVASVIMFIFAACTAAFTEVIRLVHSPIVIFGAITLGISFFIMHKVSIKDLWKKYRAK